MSEKFIHIPVITMQIFSKDDIPKDSKTFWLIQIAEGEGVNRVIFNTHGHYLGHRFWSFHHQYGKFDSMEMQDWLNEGENIHVSNDEIRTERLLREEENYWDEYGDTGYSDYADGDYAKVASYITTWSLTNGEWRSVGKRRIDGYTI